MFDDSTGKIRESILKKNAIISKIFSRKSDIEKMIVWKLKENKDNPENDSKILDEIIHLLIKNFKIKKFPKIDKSAKKRKKDMNFLSRGKGNILLWKGRKVSVKAPRFDFQSNKQFKKKSKGFFLEFKSSTHKTNIIKNLHLMNKSLEVKPKICSKVFGNQKIPVNRDILNLNSKSLYNRARRYSKQVYQMPIGKQLLKHNEHEFNQKGYNKSQKDSVFKPKISLNDFKEIQIETKDLKNSVDSRKPLKKIKFLDE